MILERSLQDGFRVFALHLGQLRDVYPPAILDPRLEKGGDFHSLLRMSLMSLNVAVF